MVISADKLVCFSSGVVMTVFVVFISIADFFNFFFLFSNLQHLLFRLRATDNSNTTVTVITATLH